MPSDKILEKKKKQVDEISSALKNSCVGVLLNYKGINVEDDTKLRKQLRDSGCSYKVIKNTILSRAFEAAGIEGMQDYLKGTTALAYSEDDYVTGPKILSEYAKKLESFEIKGGFIDGGVVTDTQINALAKLPPKEVLVAQALGGLNSPIQGFANVLSGTMRGLVIALNAIAEKTPA